MRTQLSDGGFAIVKVSSSVCFRKSLLFLVLFAFRILGSSNGVDVFIPSCAVSSDCPTLEQSDTEW